MRGLSTKVTISSSHRADAERLLELLAALGRRSPLRDPVAGLVEELQLTPVQVHALMWVGRDGPLTMGELARRLGSSERAVTGIVDRLERGGFARRARAEDDRRVVRVHLERSGSAAFRALNARVLERLSTLLALLDPADRTALFGILSRLGDVLARASARPR